MPTIVAMIPNINDYGRFADSGPDDNWYVGFNNAWIVQLPEAPAGDYGKAFIGAKLGRAKTRQKSGSVWVREPVPGKVYIAISHKPAFSPEQSFFLAETEDIPLDADPKVYVPGSGQSQWFWAQVPTSLVSFTSPNYLIVWSPTEGLDSAAASPILAASEPAPGTPAGPHAWVNNSLQGVPPRRTDNTLQTPITNLLPAVAIKLAPPNDGEVLVHECGLEPAGRAKIFSFSVEAENAELAWVETSSDQLTWDRVTRYRRHPPYHFTIQPEALQPRPVYLRGAASDTLGNLGYCDGVLVTSDQ